MMVVVELTLIDLSTYHTCNYHPREGGNPEVKLGCKGKKPLLCFVVVEFLNS